MAFYESKLPALCVFRLLFLLLDALLSDVLCSVVGWISASSSSRSSSTFRFLPAATASSAVEVEFIWFFAVCEGASNVDFFFLTLRGLGPLGPFFFFFGGSEDEVEGPTRARSEAPVACRRCSSVWREHCYSIVSYRYSWTYQCLGSQRRVAWWFEDHHRTIDMYERCCRYRSQLDAERL